MVSSAHMSYPTTVEEEKDESAMPEVSEEDIDDMADEEDREDEDLADEGVWPQGVPKSRDFDISPEEFCGDPYEQHGHVETRQELGKKGEDAAAAYLESKGFEIIRRNWFCRFGEADIIARDEDGSLCFIEVKTRRSVEAGLPEEAITEDKRQRYERIALCFMMVSDEWDDNDAVRFDAIGICVTGPHRALLRHHRNCFNASF